METTSLLKREEMTPRLGGSTDVLLIYGQSFSVRKLVQDEQFLSSSESGLRFLMNMHFPVQENGPDRTVIFVMKMVRWIADVP
jgi:hypothetical protein